jgi:hypothetical protein
MTAQGPAAEYVLNLEPGTHIISSTMRRLSAKNTSIHHIGDGTEKTMIRYIGDVSAGMELLWTDIKQLAFTNLTLSNVSVQAGSIDQVAFANTFFEGEFLRCVYWNIF